MANGNFGGGDGSELNPYLIEDIEDLIAITSKTSYLYYKLVNDLDLNVAPYNTGTGWTSLQAKSSTIDFNGKKIYNLYQNVGEGVSTGLFANGVKYAHDLELININIVGYSGSLIRHGGFISLAPTESKYERIKVTGKIKVNKGGTYNISNCGGIIGNGSSTLILKDVISEVDLELFDGCQRAGGIIGYSVSELRNAIYIGIMDKNVTYSTAVGAISGYSQNTNSTFEDCYYDKELNPQNFTITNNSTGLTSEQMKTSSNFTNLINSRFNIDKRVWNIADGEYPRLWFEPAPPQNKALIKFNENYHYLNSENEWISLGRDISEELFLDYGMSNLNDITDDIWDKLNGIIEITYYSDNKNEIEITIETEPFTLSDELGSTFSILEYTDNPTQDDSVITAETEPYSVYDYISENPEVLVYTELNDDVTVETTTEPFTIYDEFGNEVEVLHYTDDSTVENVDLILEANYSPIDELEGDFEVVTWTNEIEDTERVLELKGIPSPKFIHQLKQVSIGELLKVLVIDNSETNIENSNVRYLFSSDNSNWYSFKNESFVRVNPINNDTIKANGNTAIELLKITKEQFKTWSFDKINVGVYLEDDIRDNIISKIGENTITHESYIDSPLITGNSLYILNTTALIDVELIGNSIFGELSDEDATRVQYRVTLNGQPYFPTNGEYTALAESPQSIGINFTSSEIKIDDWNDVVIEFKDYFGKEDSWSARFIGRYSGILFRDENGENYSTDVGAILKYLDFGTVITGQYTPVYKVMLKNTYGFDVKELKLEANTEGFPEGLVVEFDTEQEFLNPKPNLTKDFLANDDETPFYIRMNSPINTQPNGANYFDIYVSAKRDV